MSRLFPAVFLDKDGTLIEDVPSTWTRPAFNCCRGSLPAWPSCRRPASS